MWGKQNTTTSEISSKKQHLSMVSYMYVVPSDEVRCFVSSLTSSADRSGAVYVPVFGSSGTAVQVKFVPYSMADSRRQVSPP